MKQLIEDIAKALVDIPEEVAVREVSGEQVTVLELKVAPSDLGKVIDAAINAGATDVSSIQFLSTNIEQARRSALTEAVKQARMDADAMARAAGGALGKLITVNTTGVSQPVVFRGGGMDNVMLTSASSGGMPTPITPGDVAVIAMVFTRWEFVSSPAR